MGVLQLADSRFQNRLTGRRALGACAALAFTLAGALPALAQSLERQLRDVLGDSQLAGVSVGVCVVDTATGESLATINERQALAPASNLKLLSTGAALWTLGKDFEFRTKIVRSGEDRLVIVGAGDPGLAEPRLLDEMKTNVGAFVDRLAEAVQKAGPNKYAEIILDDRIFDQSLIHPSWPEDQLTRWYAAEVSGLMFHGNLLQVFPQAAGRPGPSPAPRTEPSAPWIEIANQALTVGTGTTSVWVARDNTDPFRFRLMGSLRATPEEPIEVAVHDGGMYFARMLADRLVAAGLSKEATIAVRRAGETESVPTGETLAVVRTPLARVLKRANTDSYNLYAEALLKRVGHDISGQPGSWANGATVVRMLMSEKARVDTGDLVIADGSGLSKENRITAQMLAQWLGALARDPAVCDAFIASLAVPGEGTFQKRFKGKEALIGSLAGKSGFINGVQCLSGYVTQPSGKRVAFSILVNNTGKAPGGSVKEFHERVVRQIDKWMNGKR